MKSSENISDQLVSAFRTAQHVVAFTGAGMSAESGVPTFRGDDGIWKTFKPEELANLNAFMRNPALVWEWYAARKKVIAEVQPNPGHYALAEMERKFSSFAVITQNIDNLHRRAGNKNVFELHGNIERNYCMKCGTNFTNEYVLAGAAVPQCTCGGMIRPDVVWFGEMLPEDEWEGAIRACRSADVLLSVGTSGVVYPAASLPQTAKLAGAYVIEINPEPTSLSSHADVFLQGKSGEILPAILAAIR
ncbi:MAG: NAD-dependent deacylase [Ignavibacteriae bacterium]|nr:NAD-dependent deacylase [Ignavibacteriota bacterium]